MNSKTYLTKYHVPLLSIVGSIGIIIGLIGLITQTNLMHITWTITILDMMYAFGWLIWWGWRNYE